MTSEPIIRYEVFAHTALIRLARAEKRNALSRAMVIALREAFERALAESSVRVILFTGSGSAFCAGMDLEELRTTIDAHADSPEILEDTLRLARLYDDIYRSTKPTIAAVNGIAVAGGAGLVSVCDLALAVPSARFGYPEVRRGLVASIVMPHLLRLVGERTARWLLLMGETIDAESAQACGLINTIVAEDTLIATALRWASTLAEGGPEALRATKSMLARLAASPLSLEESALGSAAPRFGEECHRGLRAFFQQQPAPWSPGA